MPRIETRLSKLEEAQAREAGFVIVYETDGELTLGAGGPVVTRAEVDAMTENVILVQYVQEPVPEGVTQ